jgi:hypothetical protein
MTIGYKIFRVPMWHNLFSSIKVRLIRVIKKKSQKLIWGITRVNQATDVITPLLLAY